MNKNTNNDLSLESIVNSLFSVEEEETEVLPEVKAEDLGADVVEFTEEETEIFESPVDEDEGADAEAVAEEAMGILGEIGQLQLAMRAAEEYIWNQSTEAVDIAASVKKFWEWLKKILEKVRMFILTAIKRVQIWLAGDMKATAKWATENKAEIEKGIADKGNEITLKIKNPIGRITSIEIPGDIIRAGVDELQSGKVTDETGTKLKTYIDSVSVKSLNEMVYGKDTKSADVKLADFNKLVPIVKTLTDTSSIKTNLQGMVASAQISSKYIAVAKKNAADSGSFDKDEMKKIKTLATLCQKTVNTSVSVSYWALSHDISNVKIAKAYAKKAIAAVGKKEEKK